MTLPTGTDTILTANLNWLTLSRVVPSGDQKIGRAGKSRTTRMADTTLATAP
ncbi:MAG: hypothetical protein M3552_14480 [Planctomycetota bacterium]|nr:hypothetical protein [Planctomycetaceae bacterium]MDQ3331837.1 hypothetical protein [Planctomycetota bacterium]